MRRRYWAFLAHSRAEPLPLKCALHNRKMNLMATKKDPAFYERVDDHLKVSNDHMTPTVGVEEANASMMFALARFNAWMTAHSSSSAAAMRESRSARIAYFVGQYQTMLEENMDTYIENFERYTQRTH